MYPSVSPGFLGNVFSCIVLWFLWWRGFPNVTGKPRTWGKKPNSGLPLSLGLSKWHMILAFSVLGTLLEYLKDEWLWRFTGADPQGVKLWHHWRQQQSDAQYELQFSKVAKGTWHVPFFSKYWDSTSDEKSSKMEIPKWRHLRPAPTLNLLCVFSPIRH